MEDRQISPKVGGLRGISGIHGFKGGSCQLFFIGVVLQRLGWHLSGVPKRRTK